ncbi:MAG: MFS transporter [Planctomycetia bacterium]|nr:MFS transporter [Planctomycetia bacterium]
MNYVDRYVLAAVIPKLRAEFFPNGGEHADAELGSLALAFMISYMIASPIFGWMADRMSRWLIVAGGVIVWSLASGASGLAQTFTMLLVTRIFVGIGEAAYGPAAPTIIADLYPVERRGSVLAWFYVAIPVGSALGYTFGGLMAEHSHWRWAFYLSVVPGILLGVWALFMREPSRGGAQATAPKRAAKLADYLVFLKTPSYLLNTLGMTMMTFAVGGISYWMPDYVHRFRNGGDLGSVSFTFGAITAVAGLTATLLGGYVGDKLRTRYSGSYFLVSGIGMLLGWPLFLAVLVTPFPYAWGLIFLAEFCLFFNTGPSNTILANVVHPAVRASAFAFNIFVIHALGDAISPLLIGWINGRNDGNMNYGFAAVSVAILFSGVFWILGAKHLQRDTELADTRLAA